MFQLNSVVTENKWCTKSTLSGGGGVKEAGKKLWDVEEYGKLERCDRIEYDGTLEEYCFDGESEFHLCIDRFHNGD